MPNAILQWVNFNSFAWNQKDYIHRKRRFYYYFRLQIYTIVKSFVELPLDAIVATAGLWSLRDGSLSYSRIFGNPFIFVKDLLCCGQILLKVKLPHSVNEFDGLYLWRNYVGCWNQWNKFDKTTLTVNACKKNSVRQLCYKLLWF